MSTNKPTLLTRPTGAALSVGAVAAASAAVLAWAACCVLPLALATAGLSAGVVAWLAGQRGWITALALALFAVGGWGAWRQSRQCRTDGARPPRSRRILLLLGLAGALLIVALIWQPLLEAPLFRMLLQWQGAR